MSAIVRFLLISAAIVIPWGVIRVADLEMKLMAVVKRVLINDMVIIALLLIPPLLFFVVRWLFAPRNKQSKSYSGNQGIIIKFRG